VGLAVLLLLYVVAGGVETPRAPGRLDLTAALLASLALVAGVGALALAGQRGWADPLVIGGLAVSGMGVGAFVLRELRQAAPLIDPRLFADMRFAASNGV